MKPLVTALVVLLVFSASAYAEQQGGMGAGMMGGQEGRMGGMEEGQMMGGGESSAPQGTSRGIAGARIFMNNCARCHPGGGNNVTPDLPLEGSAKLANFKTFLAFIRNPKMPDGSEGVMPHFTKSSITDRQAKELYHYIVSSEGRGMAGGYGYGMGPGMMGGYGMGPGMMGAYGMAPSMMGGYGMGPGYYSYSPECQKFYEETAALRKELHDKRFEYFEVIRNPKTTGETAAKLEKDIDDLQDKIYAKAPLGCVW
ncbi:MAG: c-type cytochrome [Chloroflexota bacterium]